MISRKKESTSAISTLTVYVIDPRDDRWWPSCGYNTAWRCPPGHLWIILYSCFLEFCVTIGGWMYGLTLASRTIRVYHFLIVEKPWFANLWYCCIACAQRYLQPSSSISSSICNQVNAIKRSCLYQVSSSVLEQGHIANLDVTLDLGKKKTVEANWSESWNGCNDVGYNGWAPRHRGPVCGLE